MATSWASTTIWAILNHHLGLPQYAERQARREWKKVLHESAAGKTLVVIGFGKIARRWAGSPVRWGCG
jgi:phosphoglycerate dehydrogenase-like enzyme